MFSKLIGHKANPDPASVSASAVDGWAVEVPCSFFVVAVLTQALLDEDICFSLLFLSVGLEGCLETGAERGVDRGGPQYVIV